MWIKASGTLLAEAEPRDIFVDVDLPPLNAAIARADPQGRPAGANSRRVPGGLRPSIETSLHSVFPHRVVVHVHCVNTIALAIRQDARERLAERLQQCRLGLRALRQARRDGSQPPRARRGSRRRTSSCSAIMG